MVSALNIHNNVVKDKFLLNFYQTYKGVMNFDENFCNLEIFSKDEIFNKFPDFKDYLKQAFEKCGHNYHALPFFPKKKLYDLRYKVESIMVDFIQLIDLTEREYYVNMAAEIMEEIYLLNNTENQKERIFFRNNLENHDIKIGRVPSYNERAFSIINPNNQKLKDIMNIHKNIIFNHKRITNAFKINLTVKRQTENLFLSTIQAQNNSFIYKDRFS